MVTRLVLVAVLLAAGCTTAPPSGDFCQLAAPARFADATIDAMPEADIDWTLRHNRLGARLCAWTP